jgi:hypothetical protein
MYADLQPIINNIQLQIHPHSFFFLSPCVSVFYFKFIQYTDRRADMYLNPHQKAAQLEESIEVDDKETQQQFDEFYEDVFTELGNCGEIEEMHVTGNLGGISLALSSLSHQY